MRMNCRVFQWATTLIDYRQPATSPETRVDAKDALAQERRRHQAVEQVAAKCLSCQLFGALAQFPACFPFQCWNQEAVQGIGHHIGQQRAERMLLDQIRTRTAWWNWLDRERRKHTAMSTYRCGGNRCWNRLSSSNNDLFRRSRLSYHSRWFGWRRFHNFCRCFHRCADFSDGRSFRHSFG